MSRADDLYQEIQDIEKAIHESSKAHADFIAQLSEDHTQWEADYEDFSEAHEEASILIDRKEELLELDEAADTMEADETRAYRARII